MTFDLAFRSTTRIALFATLAWVALPVAAQTGSDDADASFAQFVRDKRAVDEAAAALMRKPIIEAVLADRFADAEAATTPWIKALPGWKGAITKTHRTRAVLLAVKDATLALLLSDPGHDITLLLTGFARYSFSVEPTQDFRATPPMLVAALMVAEAYAETRKVGTPDDAQLAKLELAFLATTAKAEGEDSPMLVDMLGQRADRLAARGAYLPAQPDYERMLAIQIKADGTASGSVGDRLYDLAKNTDKLGRAKDAEALYRRIVPIRDATNGKASAEAIVARNNLATHLFGQKRHAEAEPIFAEVLADLAGLADGGADYDGIRKNAADNLAALGKTGAAAALRKSIGATPQAEAAIAADDPRSLVARAEQANAKGRYGEAVEIMQDALVRTTAIRGPDHADTVFATGMLAKFLTDAGRHDEALPLAETGLASAQRLFGYEAAQTAQAYDLLARSQVFLGRIDGARDNRKKAITILEAVFGATSPELAAVYNNMGSLVQGQALVSDDATQNAASLAEAESWFRKSLAAQTSASLFDPGLLTAMGNLGDVLIKRGRAVDAIPYLGRIVAAQAELYGPVHHDLAVSQLTLAEAMIKAPGRLSDGFSAARQAVGTLRQVNEANRDASGRTSVHNHNDHYETLIAAAWSLSQLDTSRNNEAIDAAFGAAQDLSTTRSSAAMAQAAIRAAAGSGAMADLLREVETARARVSENEFALQSALSSNSAVAPESIAIGLRGERKALTALEARRDREFPQYAALVSPRPLTIAEVQAALDDDEAVLLIIAVEEDMFSFAISKQAAQWSRANGLAQRAAVKLGVLRCSVDDVTCQALTQVLGNIEQDSPMAKAGYRPFPLATAHELYRDFVAPVAPALASAKRLYFTTTGPLSDLPLALLLTAPPAAGADFADPKTLAGAPWLGNDFAITRLPSVSGLRLAATARASGNGFKGYGSPVLDGDGLSPDRGGGLVFTRTGTSLLADPGMLRTLSPLPGTKVELLAMAQALGAAPDALRLGEAATETAIKQDSSLEKAAILAFATHGLLPGEAVDEGEPGLVMTPPNEATAIDDGILTASEAAALTLNADWVILSACNTASGEGDAGGDSLSGLARGFLYAGAQALLASHWRVSDDATAALTVETLLARKSNPALTRSQALQQAEAIVRTGRRPDGTKLESWNDSWSHPTNWAPFSNIAYRDR